MTFGAQFTVFNCQDLIRKIHEFLPFEEECKNKLVCKDWLFALEKCKHRFTASILQLKNRVFFNKELLFSRIKQVTIEKSRHITHDISIEKCTRLQKIQFQNIFLGCSRLQKIVTNFPSFCEEITFDHVSIHPNVLIKIFRQNQTHLKNLTVRSANIRDHGLAFILSKLPVDLQSLHLEKAFLSLDGLVHLMHFQFPKLQKLDLSKNNFSDANGQLASWLPSTIEDLNVSSTKLSTDFFESLLDRKFNCLKSLSVADLSIEDTILERLCLWMAPSVTSLNLSNVSSSDLLGSYVLKLNLSSILQLNLSFNPIRKDHLEQILSLLSCDLQSLNLARCCLDTPILDLLQMNRFPYLTCLDVSYNHMGGEWEPLASTLSRSITYLNLSGLNFNQDAVVAFSNWNGKNLQNLSLIGSRVNSMGPQFVNWLPNSLTSLNLSQSDVYKYFDSFIQKLIFFNFLKVLNLHNCNLRDELEVFSKQLPSTLEELTLSRNQITCKGATYLAKNLPKKINKLDLSFNRIGKIGAAYISLYSSCCAKINLRGNPSERAFQNILYDKDVAYGVIHVHENKIRYIAFTFLLISISYYYLNLFFRK